MSETGYRRLSRARAADGADSSAFVSELRKSGESMPAGDPAHGATSLSNRLRQRKNKSA